MGGTDLIICSNEGAGVMADVVEAYLQAFGEALCIGVKARRHIGHNFSRGGMLWMYSMLTGQKTKPGKVRLLHEINYDEARSSFDIASLHRTLASVATRLELLSLMP